MTSSQWANWQRGGGKGPQPERIARPDDRAPAAPVVQTAGELAARKAEHKAEMTRRRDAKKAR